MIQDKRANCILCGHTKYKRLRDFTDIRFGILGEYSIIKCHYCGLLQTIPIPDPDDLKELYEKYYNFRGEKETTYVRFRNFFLDSFAYRIWLNIDGDVSFYLRKGKGRLLDVGCNEGRGMSIYHRNGFDPEGLELNKRAAQYARKAGFNVHIQTFGELKAEKPFDIVVLSNVLEHASDPYKMLKNVHRALNSDGHVWISCPNSQSWLRRLFGRSWINWHVPFHLFHFSKKTLSQLLERSGFEIKKLKFVTPSHWLTQSIIVAIFAKPGQKTRQLCNPILVAFLMILCRFFFPLLWFGNMTGYGDCLVVEAVPKDKP